MKIYNTMTRRKEEFVPLREGKVGMYVCGPTVYNLIHIGNARPMIVFDTVRRYFEYRGYDVNFVSNFTDVDDKIIAKANEEGVDASVISARYIAECKKDMAALNVRPATTHPLATEEIGGMIDMIGTLIEKGYAYNVNGTVYFRTRRFAEYGKLSHKNIDELRSGSRDLKVTGEEEKEDPLDFVLWKPKKEGEPFWKSPWSDGRPGWHIECSVMAKKYLGEEIDIHAGGEDLIFPHHENEIAQSECCNGKPFAKYWMHNGFLKINGMKLAKSFGNFLTVRDVCEEYDPQVLRFFILSAHYRNPLNFSEEIMESSKNGLERIVTAAGRLRELAKSAVGKEMQSAGSGKQPVGDNAAQPAGGNAQTADEGGTSDLWQPSGGSTAQPGTGMTAAETEKLREANTFRAKFEAAMDDDFNTADAITAIFELVRFANTEAGEESSAAFLEALNGELEELCGILGLKTEAREEQLDSEIEALIAERQAARKNRDFAKADAIRDRLQEKGIILEDTREGVKWKRV